MVVTLCCYWTLFELASLCLELSRELRRRILDLPTAPLSKVQSVLSPSELSPDEFGSLRVAV